METAVKHVSDSLANVPQEQDDQLVKKLEIDSSVITTAAQMRSLLHDLEFEEPKKLDAAHEEQELQPAQLTLSASQEMEQPVKDYMSCKSLKIDDLQWAVVEKDKKIKMLQFQLAERDKEIVSLHETITELKKELEKTCEQHCTTFPVMISNCTISHVVFGDDALRDLSADALRDLSIEYFPQSRN